MKTFRTILALAIFACSTWAFSACNDDNEPDFPDNPQISGKVKVTQNGVITNEFSVNVVYLYYEKPDGLNILICADKDMEVKSGMQKPPVGLWLALDVPKMIVDKTVSKVSDLPDGESDYWFGVCSNDLSPKKWLYKKNFKSFNMSSRWSERTNKIQISLQITTKDSKPNQIEVELEGNYGKMNHRIVDWASW